MNDPLHFVAIWLEKHQGNAVEHDAAWRHFACLMAECANDYYKFMTENKTDYGEIIK